jgi:hypothetical protein
MRQSDPVAIKNTISVNTFISRAAMRPCNILSHPPFTNILIFLGKLIEKEME